MLEQEKFVICRFVGGFCHSTACEEKCAIAEKAIANMGWECPKCHFIHSPSTSGCSNCNQSTDPEHEWEDAVIRGKKISNLEFCKHCDQFKTKVERPPCKPKNQT